MSAIRVPLSEPGYSTAEPAHAEPRIVFTRQLWERTMPNTDTNDINTRSRNIQIASRDQGASKPRTTSSVDPVPVQSQPSPILSRVSNTPPTPEELPPSWSNSRKRSADTFDQDNSGESSPAHDNPGDSSSVNICFCQPEPKVPRPRNAFILYRQNFQAAAVARNPGLPNPDISKIIGEQWRNEPDEEKDKWKAYAEEEKLQHQQRWPLYRYQPKRSGRRASVSSDAGSSTSEPRRCPKCGGRNIAHPSTELSSSSVKDKRDNPNNTSAETSPTSALARSSRNVALTLPPPTPSSTTTPSTRYLPMLNSLSLASPHSRRMAQGRPLQSFAPLQQQQQQQQQQQHQHMDEGKPSPHSPDAKRRRFESPQGTYVMSTRAISQQQNDHPGTPFPFYPQQPQQKISASQHQSNALSRRESLPPAADILRGRLSTSTSQSNMMGPPPRPGPGYAQHRISQGHARPPGGELSLTLPPLQTVSMPQGPPSGRAMPGYQAQGSASSAPDGGREIDKRSQPEKIMSISFHHKIGILRRIMPPLSVPKHKGRAIIVAVEGDDADAASSVTSWLAECLGRESDITVKIVDGPKPANVTEGAKFQVEDLFEKVIQWHSKNKEIVELARNGDVGRKDSASSVSAKDRRGSEDSSDGQQPTPQSAGFDSSMMDVDNSSSGDTDSPKLVIIFRTYTLTASNVYASGIPIRDVYRPDDHWQWTATLWRGMVGPDLTIYVRDSEGANSAKTEGAGKGGVEIVEEAKMKYKFMAVKRSRSGVEGKGERGGCEGVEAGTLRRLGFEVGEWVRSVAITKVEGDGS